METTFYHDEGMAARGKDTVQKLKSKMTLDFNSGPPTKKQLLQSPDLNLLKLASPELEKLIIQHNGMVTTPTPTQILFPRSVTEEQEAYARGFVDALAQLHKNEDDENSTDSEQDRKPPQSNLVTLQNAAPVSSTAYSFATLAPLPDSLASNQPSRNSTPFSQAKVNNLSVPTTVTSQGHGPVHDQLHEVPHSQSSFMSQVMANQLVRLKEEPQTVPTLSNTPPMSPINMLDQEKAKTERKRARNRVAARKCRYRKLERISRLEDRVSDLKSQNGQLSNDANKLKEQVLKLKQQILEHVNSGCNIMISGAL